MNLNRVLVTSVFLTVISVFCAAAPENAIQEKFATIGNGLKIHYLEIGPSAAQRTLILIPGWRLPADLWRGVMQKFGQSERVIAIDPRSQGQSTKTEEGNTPENRARDLHELLASLRISQPVLVGWSQGAQDLAAYIGQFGDAGIRGVVFVDTAVSSGPAEVELHKELSKAILSNISLYAAHPEEMSEGMVHSIFKRPHPELDIQSIVKFTMQTPVSSGVAMLVTDIFGADRMSPLARFNKPALVIGSADSPLVDLEKSMAASMPEAKFVALENTAHAVFIDDPEGFDNALEAFLKSLAQ